MGTVELQAAEAARWVWESLWSARRHARMDILDVSLLDQPPNAATPAIAQWLFTARDGRVMKKSSITASLAALKQTLLGQAICRAGSDNTPNYLRGETATAIATGMPFATALLSSGGSVLVDENAWETRVLGRSAHHGERDDVVAVMALFPGDSPAFRRGPRQRLVCEYRLKEVCAWSEGGAGEAFATPIHAVTTTFILVNSSLLRGGEKIPGQSQEKAEVEVHQSGTTEVKNAVDGRLVSRVQATNREVENKLRRIVQWVQEVRRVHVLSMTAMFTVLPSSGNGAPGVWLERVIGTRLVQNEDSNVVPAPYADADIRPPPLNTERPCDARRREEPSHPIPCSHQRELETLPESLSQRIVYQPTDGESLVVQPTATGQPNSVTVFHEDNSDQGHGQFAPPPSTAIANFPQHDEQRSVLDTLGDSGGLQQTTAPVAPEGERQQSVSEILEEAAKAALSASSRGEQATPAVQGDRQESRRDDDGESAGYVVTADSLPRQRGGSSGEKAPEATQRITQVSKCAGDFCVFREELSRSTKQRPAQEKSGEHHDEDVENINQRFDWTDIGMSNEGNILLEVEKRRSAPSMEAGARSTDDDMLFSITFKSICVARMEACQGQDFHWGETLRKCWRESKSGIAAGILEGVNPAVVYKEVLVCRACYDVYRRLDQLRGEVDRVGNRDAVSMNQTVPLRLDSSPTGGQRKRGAAVEAGAARLNADLTAMLRDVDVRSGKLGIEAGIIWRRRLSKSKSSGGTEFATERRQARLVDRLARPKPKSQQENDSATPPTLSSSKRQVKSQGDLPDVADNNTPACVREGGSQVLSSSPWRGNAGVRKSSRHGLAIPVRSFEEEVPGVQSNRMLPPGMPRRNAWPLTDENIRSHGESGHEAPKEASDRASTTSDFAPSLPNVHRSIKSTGAVCLKHRSFAFATSGGRPSLHAGNDGETPGGSIRRGERSGVTIRAIEAMLQSGGDGYLPACARDLPEAAAILGPRVTSSKCGRGKDKRAAKDGRRQERRRAGGKGDSRDRSRNVKYTTVGRDGEQERSDCASPESEMSRQSAGNRKGFSSRSRQDMVLERFLHPWQRKLEAEKRQKCGWSVEDEESALANEQRRRSEARRAAALSDDCRRAARRVAARLGHQQHRSRARYGGNAARNRGQRNLAANAELDDEHGASPEGSAWPIETASSQNEADRTPGAAHALEQMRDSLGWARKTMVALAKRLDKKGVDLRSAQLTGKQRMSASGKVGKIMEEMQRHLEAFGDDVLALGSHLAGSTTEEMSSLALAKRFDQASETFESEFYQLIEKMTATVGKAQLNDSNSDPSSGYCPVCGVLPVARRCLDCKGGREDRDRCSGCFVRDHRDVSRRDHRFLRIGSSGEAATVGERRGAATDPTSQAVDSVQAIAVPAIKAKRDPAENSGKRNAATSVLDGVSSNAETTSGIHNCGRVDCDVEMGEGREEDTEAFDADAARSLAQVRRTVAPPMVRPLPPATVTDSTDAQLNQEERLPIDDPGNAMTCRSRERPEGSDTRTPPEEREGGSFVYDGATVSSSEEHDGQCDVDGPCGDRVDENMGRKDGSELFRRHDGEVMTDGGGEAQDDQNGEETDGASSAEDDSDDEGMMWSPLNIAAGDIDASKVSKTTTASSPNSPARCRQHMSTAVTEAFESRTTVASHALGRGGQHRRDGDDVTPCRRR